MRDYVVLVLFKTKKTMEEFLEKVSSVLKL